ncbi:MAG TPA: hypothetical protein VFU59_02145 [Candidatus Eisenbacteria bacterium]|nr:hypothetical protein [Candidatus Eisenbacteria bacterium]
MNDAWQRRLLLVAATWNIVGGITALLDPGKHFAQLFTTALDLTEPLQLFFFRCVWINVIAWGLAYLLAAFWAASRKAILVAGALGKAAYAAACFALFAGGIGTNGLFAAGVVDSLFAIFFFAAFLAQRARGALTAPATNG